MFEIYLHLVNMKHVLTCEAPRIPFRIEIAIRPRHEVSVDALETEHVLIEAVEAPEVQRMQ